MTRRRLARLLLAVALGVALAWTAFVAHWHIEGRASALDRIEAVTLDLRTLLAPSKAPPADVIIVAIDDETVRQAGGYPLPRDAMALLVDAIARRKPKAVALDLLFIDPSVPAQDMALASALAAAPSVIAAAGLFADGETPRYTTGPASGLIPRPMRLLWPIAPLASASEVGLVNIATDYGGMPRHVPMLFRGPEGLIPSFILLTAALATAEGPRFTGDSVTLGTRTVPLDLGQHLALRFYGPRGTIPSISAVQLTGPTPPDLSGRTIIVGTTATGSGDTFPTPFSPVVPGVEVLATAVGNLMAGDGLLRNRQTRWFDAGAAAVLAICAVLFIAMQRTAVGFALCAALALAWVMVTFVAFTRGYWLSTTLPLAAMLPVAIAYGGVRLWQERRTVRYLAGVEERLTPFQPRPIAARLTEDPGFLAEPVAQNAAVIFVDLAGYTGLSEAWGAARTRDLLKSFHTLVDETVDAHGGFVATFMGDGAMILFGFPDRHEDDAARALRALDDLDQRLKDWAVPVAGEEGPRPHARLTAHYGPVIVSRLGGHNHQQVTATGDTVNVASRLQEVAKGKGVTIVITEDMVRAAGGEAPLDRFPIVDEVPIRGRHQPMAIRVGASAASPAHQ